MRRLVQDEVRSEERPYGPTVPAGFKGLDKVQDKFQSAGFGRNQFSHGIDSN